MPPFSPLAQFFDLPLSSLQLQNANLLRNNKLYCLYIAPVKRLQSYATCTPREGGKTFPCHTSFALFSHKTCLTFVNIFAGLCTKLNPLSNKCPLWEEGTFPFWQISPKHRSIIKFIQALKLETKKNQRSNKIQSDQPKVSNYPIRLSVDYKNGTRKGPFCIAFFFFALQETPRRDRRDDKSLGPGHNAKLLYRF